MTEDTPMHDLTPEQMMAQIQEFMNHCEELLKNKTEPDMRALKDKMQTLTDKMKSLPITKLASMQGGLQELMNRLTDLQKRLENYRDEIKGEVHALDSHKQANTAYQTVQSSTNPQANDND